MDKSNILHRLELLADLCETTEPDVPSDKQLFSNHLIEVQNMITLVTNIESGKVDFGPSNEREQITEVMRSSNKIWKFRNKVKNGEVDTIDHTEMIDEIEDHLAHGQKINAIKYYREEMKVRFGERVTLREAKDFVDSIDDDLKRKGIVRSFTRK
jgi:ribosomal protein L7/L12